MKKPSKTANSVINGRFKNNRDIVDRTLDAINNTVSKKRLSKSNNDLVAYIENMTYCTDLSTIKRESIKILQKYGFK